MATINVSSSQNIRDAISGGSPFSVPASGDTIAIAAGTFNITSTVIPSVPGPGAIGPATFAYAAQPNINSVTGFTGPTNLIFSGAGNSNDLNITTVIGNSRLYVGNSDGMPPTSLDFRNLDFLYSGGSGYLLQTGNFGVPSSVTQSINLDNLSFRGTHLGAGGTDNPKGNYGALLGFNTLTLNNSIVSLTGQNNFVGNNPVSNGSSFLMLQGNSMTISSNQFDESGYRNALSIFDSTSVTLSNNTFSRNTPSNRYVRIDAAPTATPWLLPTPTPKSNKISKSTGVVVTNNTFQDGSFLALEGGSGSVTSNTFNGQDALYGSAYGSPGALGILLEPTAAPITNPSYSISSNTFRFVSPIVNKTAAISTITQTNTIINPIGGASLSVGEFVTGTSAGEVVASSAPATARSEFLSGGLGNDTLNGGNSNPTTAADNDFFLFDTAPDTALNSDTIINFQRVLATGATDRLVLSRAIYRDLTTTSTVTGGGANQIGGLVSGGGGQIFNSGSAVNFTSGTQRIALITSGAQQGELWYDRDGSGGSYSPIRFVRIFTDNGTTGLNSVSALGNVFVI